MPGRPGRVRPILARLGFEDDGASCAVGRTHHRWCATVHYRGCGKQLGMVGRLGVVIVLRRERLV